MTSSLPGNGLRAGVAGVGFIGQVHVASARAAGAKVTAISGGRPERTQKIADDLAIDKVFASSEELATSPDIDVLHICTPNALHSPLARLALEAGKHVICEKPLATSVEDASAMVELANARNLVAAVPFVYRFHPVVRDARARVAGGEAGNLRLIHGSYQQDWLATPGDYNWRLDHAQGGGSVAFADIGTHWCDLIEFVTGHRITRLNARTLTTVKERIVSHSSSFAAAATDGARVNPTGEDAVLMMFETDKGSAGSVVISQVSHGRKNRLWFELDGENEAITFNQEENERLWIGKRERQEIIVRDPSVNSPDAARLSVVPTGHAQGYIDAFNGFVADTFRAIKGATPEGLPVFADGLRAARITQTVLDSSKSGEWKEVGE